jgi:outer membrane protein assembly factor BamB
MRKIVWAGVALFAVGCWMPGAFADWPRFRGPNGSGVDATANTPATFTDKDYNWKIDLPGIGHSSPVIIGKKIFITCAETDGSMRYLVCADLDTGKTLWKKEYASRGFRQNSFNSFSSASAVADGERVYFTFIAPEAYTVYCVGQDGSDKWTYDMGRWESAHGCGCSPMLVDDLLIVPNDQDGPNASIVALDKVTGSQRWRIARKTAKNGAAASTPCIFEPKGGAAQLITSSRAGVMALDPKTGKTIWAFPDSMPFRPVGSPIATENMVVATCGEGGANRSCVAIKPGAADGSGAKLLYKMPTGANYPYVPSAIINGEDLFLCSDVGTVTCVKAETGKVVWQEKLKSAMGKPEFFTSPIITGNKLYLISKKGEVICLEAGEKFKELGRSRLNDTCYATPAVAGDKLIIRTASHMLSVGK